MLLKNEFEEIFLLIKQGNKENPSISKSSIYWHLDHSLLIINNVSKLLKKSNPLDYKPSFNMIRSVIFMLNFFPRGKAKAPKVVHPTEAISKEELLKNLEDAKQQLKTIIDLPAKSNFKHPIFGVLNLKQTQKFLKIHTIHHLKICREI